MSEHMFIGVLSSFEVTIVEPAVSNVKHFRPCGTISMIASIEEPNNQSHLEPY
jgi:hypothetical protein